MKSAITVATVLLCLACGGCSMVLDDAGTVYGAQPGKYDYLDCPSLQRRAKASAEREAELSGLIERANQGVAGPVVSALVYREELSIVRGDRRALQKAADEKRCAPDIQPQRVQPQGAGLRTIY